mgnify:CR=1 FL=1
MASALNVRCRSRGKRLNPPNEAAPVNEGRSPHRVAVAAQLRRRRWCGEFSESSLEAATTEHVASAPVHAEVHLYSEPAREASKRRLSAASPDELKRKKPQRARSRFIVAVIVVAGEWLFTADDEEQLVVAGARDCGARRDKRHRNHAGAKRRVPSIARAELQSSTPEPSSADRDQNPTLLRETKCRFQDSPSLPKTTVTKVALWSSGMTAARPAVVAS